MTQPKELKIHPQPSGMHMTELHYKTLEHSDRFYHNDLLLTSTFQSNFHLENEIPSRHCIPPPSPAWKPIDMLRYSDPCLARLHRLTTPRTNVPDTNGWTAE
ncbi:hypothetical protein N7457_001885 [Penicillium paradoxum]|uniref:uncharacterized protein n=1 Tax=Penicillium paradoxum TaxID=176176 RepID=UPI0025487BD9|nr:uncharacterized protein N7457_001885 [Penicillium paradoxum]KAJ5795286.1 hypothetical protein N7457_001885 [Penicillium paradoxum]